MDIAETLRKELSWHACEVGALLIDVQDAGERDRLQEHFERALNQELHAAFGGPPRPVLQLVRPKAELASVIELPSAPVFRPDPKPEPSPGGIGRPKSKQPRRFRKVASSSDWVRLREAKLAPCLVCLWLGEAQTRLSTLHHVVSKSLGGDDVEENLVSLCGDGTTGHHGLLEDHDPETCRAFAAALQQYDGAAYAYAIEKLGEDGFARRHHVVFTSATAPACSCDPTQVELDVFDALCPLHGLDALLGEAP